MYLFWICHFHFTTLIAHRGKKSLNLSTVTASNMWPYHTRKLVTLYVSARPNERFYYQFCHPFQTVLAKIKRQISSWEIFAKWTLKTLDKVNKCLWICFMFHEESEEKRDVLGTFKYASGIWFDSTTLINTKRRKERRLISRNGKERGAGKKSQLN